MIATVIAAAAVTAVLVGLIFKTTMQASTIAEMAASIDFLNEEVIQFKQELVQTKSERDKFRSQADTFRQRTQVRPTQKNSQPSRAAQRPRTPSPPTPKLTSPAQPIKRGPEGIHINRQFKDKILGAKFDETLNSAYVVPEQSGGEIIGYRFKKINDDSVFRQLGFRQDDIIKTMNGNTISTPAQALQLLNQLKNTRKFNVLIDRGGSPQSLSFIID